MPIAADGIPAWDHGRGRLLNAHPVPPRFTDARPPIPVRARLLWSDTGEDWIDTEATAWRTARGEAPLVLVTVEDRRLQVIGVWLAASDVVRQGAGD